MMVDDNEDDAVVFARRLHDAGMRNPLIHFRTGAEAFLFLKDLCRDQPPSSGRPKPCLMFLDVNMPDLSGFDVLAWARQQPGLRGMKIIMLSGATEPWDAKIAAKLGADGYVPKFPELRPLSELLASHLRPLSPA